MGFNRLAMTLFVALCCPTAYAGNYTDIPIGGTISLPQFRYGEDKAFVKEVNLRRIQIYAADAKVLQALPNGAYRELPKSDRSFFVSTPDVTATRMYLSISADGSDFEGAVFAADGMYSFNGTIENGEFRLSSSEKADPAHQPFACGANRDLQAPSAEDHEVDLLNPLAGLNRQKGALHQAVLAFDTDYELINGKFGNQTTDATNYVASLVAAMSTFYERDLNVKLLQGMTILRTDVNDPYSQTSTSGQLNEVGAVWRDNFPSVNRAFVMLLSGKSPGTNSASGIAWIIGSGNYCTSKGSAGAQVFGHYSATQVFRNNGIGIASHASIVGHELGHNFGAFHTHCSDKLTGAGEVATNTIDQCYNADDGCYSGPVSCPTDNSVTLKGSIMSYCNFNAPSGAGCGQVLTEFHPAHQTRLNARIATNVTNGCLPAVNSDVGPTISANSPANNSSTAMGGGSSGSTVSSSISFTRSGGSGAGTTALSCTAGGGNLAIASGGAQSIAVGGTLSPVVAQFTLTASAQSGTVTCTAMPVNGTAANFTFNFTAPAGTAGAGCPTNTRFRSGFESGETNCN